MVRQRQAPTASHSGSSSCCSNQAKVRRSAWLPGLMQVGVKTDVLVRGDLAPHRSLNGSRMAEEDPTGPCLLP